MSRGGKAVEAGRSAVRALVGHGRIVQGWRKEGCLVRFTHPARPWITTPALHHVARAAPCLLTQRSLRTTLPVLAAGVKERVRYRCHKCENEYDRSYGRCPNCSTNGPMEKVVLPGKPNASSKAAGGGGAAMRALEDLKLAAFARREEARGGEGESMDFWLSGEGGRPPQTMQAIAKQRHRERDRIRLKGPTGKEVERVLGGGIMKGSLVLVGGDPGVGKSTLLLQLAAMVAHPDIDFDVYRKLLRESEGKQSDSQVGADDADDMEDDLQGGVAESESESGADFTAASKPVLYVSGEESARQVYGRAQRMGMGRCTNLLVLNTANLKEVLGYIRTLEPQLVVIDSIQTMVLMGLANSPGSSTQMKECTLALNRISKEQGCTVFLVGHVTKDDKIAGPRMLEHIVDAVLYFGGDRQQSHRLLRANKNRFGAVDEVGVFRMDSDGLHTVANPGGMFLEPCSTTGVSSAVACIIDGTRPFLVEIQALYQPLPQSYQGPPPRTSIGVDRDRLQQFQAIMNRHCRANVYSGALHVNVVSGHRLTDLTSDLAVVFAIMSSYRKKSIPARLCLIGEVGLGGELRASVPHLTSRLAEAAKLGFTRVVVPANVGDLDTRRFKGLQIVTAGTVQEAVDKILGKAAPRREEEEEED